MKVGKDRNPEASTGDAGTLTTTGSLGPNYPDN